MNDYRAKKSLGQNFLVDTRAVARIVAALAPRPGEWVLEIGPGRGALTRALVRTPARIAAVELDRNLAESLRREFTRDELYVIEDDVLDLDLDCLPGDPAIGAEAPLAVVGNLPYNISKPIVQKLVRDRERVDRAVLMFQREVADRLTAAPGGRDYGPLTVLAGAAFRIEKILDLAPGAFRPRPRVSSTVTSWRRREASALSESNERSLRACLGACFARRRRTLRNNLRVALGDARRTDELLARAELDGALRAEALAPSDFFRLAELWGAVVDDD